MESELSEAIELAQETVNRPSADQAVRRGNGNRGADFMICLI
jgi:hypothetical protein